MKKIDNDIDELEKILNENDAKKQSKENKHKDRKEMWLYLTTDQWSGKRDFWLVGAISLFLIGLPLLTILAIVLEKL